MFCYCLYTQALSRLGINNQIDEGRRHALIEIFDKTLDNIETLMKMDDPVVDQLRQMFPDMYKTLETEKHATADCKAPVLVLGIQQL